jgi:hypothetical protein
LNFCCCDYYYLLDISFDFGFHVVGSIDLAVCKTLNCYIVDTPRDTTSAPTTSGALATLRCVLDLKLLDSSYASGHDVVPRRTLFLDHVVCKSFEIVRPSPPPRLSLTRRTLSFLYAISPWMYTPCSTHHR